MLMYVRTYARFFGASEDTRIYYRDPIICIIKYAKFSNKADCYIFTIVESVIDVLCKNVYFYC